jgi:polysaccharide biosynthesis/export protein
MKLNFYCFLLLVFITSCNALKSRNITYFSDLPQDSLIVEQIIKDQGPVIKAEDILSITVFNLGIEDNMLFNSGIIMEPGSAGGQTGVQSGSNNSSQGYLVDDNGFIDFPVLGRIKVVGLTRQELSDRLVADLEKFLKEPMVKVRYTNFRVTVLGEVASPSVITAPDDKLNVIEALGLVGDLTIYGKRENVLIIREENGIRTLARLNLNNRASMASPYFNLHQNDVIYVEPDKAKLAGTGIIRQNWGFAVGLLSTVFFILSTTNIF